MEDDLRTDTIYVYWVNSNPDILIFKSETSVFIGWRQKPEGLELVGTNHVFLYPWHTVKRVESWIDQ